ncbi:MAG: class I SAM-dependent methyltransferase [Sulfitobacter sp.]|nr:class I SAM-dependent methyltransferase [Sulfitobacter sp.]
MGEGAKSILDMTAGPRSMWWDKAHPSTVFLDSRIVPPQPLPHQPTWKGVVPDVQADFTKLPFRDDTFDLVVFDPPHAEVLENSISAMKWGSLFGDWRPMIAKGLREGHRVTRVGGSFVFKWHSGRAAPVGDVMRLVPEMTPTFGHRTAKSGLTIWLTFYKAV